MARVAAQRPGGEDMAERVAASTDASGDWSRVADAVAELPSAEWDTLLLYVWEELSYEQIAAALDIPVGTVRSRLNRARARLPRRVPGEREDGAVSDELEPLRRLRPDNVLPDDPGDPTVLSRQKEQLMSTIAQEPETSIRMPDLFPRLAYADEFAALEYLVRVLGFTELREARMEHEWDGRQQMLAWLRLGAGIVMIGHANHDVHRIYAPGEVGHTTAIFHVNVHDIDTHYARAVEQGADITMALQDAFYGERRYEATDLEGHRWHFAESHEAIRGVAATCPTIPRAASRSLTPWSPQFCGENMGGVAWDGDEYQKRFDALAAEGVDVHGEADFVMRFAPASVLDAGCGTGRVARELARRGVAVVGVDADASMVGTARQRLPSSTGESPTSARSTSAAPSTSS